MIPKVKVVFLDRDGVINQKAKEHDYIKKPEDFLLLSGVANAIQLLNHHHYKVIVVTNQRGIARKMMTDDDLINIHEKMKHDLKKENAYIDKIYYCPHNIDENCNCRKPKIGMFLQVAADFAVDKINSYMVGDSISDMEAGIAFGIKPIFIGSNIEDFLCADNLLAAVRDMIVK
jgi:D-glycero-D-manno-heptose 1,7-bisphosphate phosphatase